MCSHLDFNFLMTEQQEGSACNFSPANESGSIVVSMSEPNQWSDWNGQRGSNPAVTEAFLEATHKVLEVGLSFGGECFFETGVTPTGAFGTEQFSSMFSEN